MLYIEETDRRKAAFLSLHSAHTASRIHNGSFPVTTTTFYWVIPADNLVGFVAQGQIDNKCWGESVQAIWSFENHAEIKS